MDLSQQQRVRGLRPRLPGDLSLRGCTCVQVRECRRLLRPGGTLALSDNNPRSKVIQNLPPVLFTLMKR